jgi:DNA-directed RNA polymerase specialized sigma24 family protein
MPEAGFHETFERARGGDSAAIARLYGMFAPLLRAVLRRRRHPALRSLADTEDLLQSVMVDLLRELPRLTDRGPVAFRHLLCIKAESKAKRRSHRAARGRTLDLARVVASRGRSRADPANGAARAESARQLHHALAQIDALSAAVVRLRCDHELGFGPIASLVGLPGADAARMRFQRATAALRSRIEGARGHGSGRRARGRAAR